jgi:hypothetical protein
VIHAGGQGYALTIDVFDAAQTTSINNWVSGHGGRVEVLENLEDITTGWYDTLDTSVGTFTAGGKGWNWQNHVSAKWRQSH